MQLMKILRAFLSITAIFGLSGLPVCAAQEPLNQAYQRPPQAILDVLNAPPTPLVSISPQRDRMLLVQGLRYPPIDELAEPMLRLAGLRINPANNGPHRSPRYVGLTVKFIEGGRELHVSLPKDARFNYPSWSPDGAQFAFTMPKADRTELWIGDASTGKVRRLGNFAINAAYGEAVQWMPDNRTLLCQLIPAKRGLPPAEPRAPKGPVIQESAGKSSTIRTYQDLLQNQHDEELFDYYATSQLAFVDTRNGRATPVGQPDIFASSEISPNGQHLLVVRNHRPYSYLLTASAFPKKVEVWDRTGGVGYKLASLPLAEPDPVNGARRGPRSYHWRPTEPATLVWVEALDRGDENNKAKFRDRLVMLKAPFTDKPAEFARTEQRYSEISWGERSDVAILRDYDRNRRWGRAFLLNADNTNTPPKLLWDRSTQDRYNDPGSPMLKSLANGKRAMRVDGNSLYLTGSGATAQGERPFLDRFDFVTMTTERLFRCDEKSYDYVVALAKEDGSQFITHHESPTEPPNYFLRSPNSSGHQPLTSFPDPAPQLRGIQKQLITYRRKDGVQLSFTLYLPAGYQAGTRLPTVVWAYPREYNDADTAGQVSGSPNRFTTLSGTSHLFLVLQGYAVLDGATMPVVGPSRTANDTFVDQIVASAQAAVDKAVELGVTDLERVGVGGHSYGAFMTANLLAHSDIFQAGIARSGAYNRTLTPFGFQSERRTLWQAAETYTKMSPLMHASKLKEPLLLIHGEADNNAGTFPIQSERMFQAVQGTGGKVRLVLLPHESHGYEARESTEHCLYEMVNWFNQYVKNAKPRPAKTVPVAVEKSANE
jgi:dipeptidyl aminopeptidase/acylaminoacyl peptidase